MRDSIYDVHRSRCILPIMGPFFQIAEEHQVKPLPNTIMPPTQDSQDTREDSMGAELAERSFSSSPSHGPSVDIDALMARRDSDSQSPDVEAGSSSPETIPNDPWELLREEDWEDPNGDGSKGMMSSQMPVPAPAWTASFIIIDINEPGGLRHMCFVRGCRRVFYYAWELHEHIRNEHDEQTLG